MSTHRWPGKTDREQIRRDAELLVGDRNTERVHRLASAYLALLAELEQAERERDVTQSKLGREIVRTQEAVERYQQAEARLAKADRLAKAARAFLDSTVDETDEDHGSNFVALRDALADWEGE